MFKTIDISTSALVAQRQRLDVIAGNVANFNSTKNADGEIAPFHRRVISFFPSEDGSKVSFEIDVDTETPVHFEPSDSHPDRINGRVYYSNVNLLQESVDAIAASRAYEANVAAIDIAKQLAQLSLRIIS